MHRPGVYPQAADLLKVEVLKDRSLQPIGLSLCCALESQDEPLRHETYLLRTNRPGTHLVLVASSISKR